MTDQQAKEAMAKLFRYLDIVEESDGGREFHPNRISSCRVLDSIEMNKLLKELKEWSSR